MSVTAISHYPARIADGVENFHGGHMLYVGWDQHLLHVAPLAWCLPPETPFRTLVETHLAAGFGADPDFAKIDWTKVEWLKSGKPWQPEMNGTLAANGLKHKDILRFRTPGLNSIMGGAR